MVAVRLLELGEDARAMLVGADADSGVRHAEAKRRRRLLHGDLDPPLPGELERVADQVRAGTA